jgi:hypothetical protein
LIAGRYTLEREVGRGGMGTVWLGRDEVLGRAVALKRIGMMPGATSPDLQRAEREARLAAMLNHPRVVAVFDLVEDDAQHWLVMEYVEGQSLSQLVADHGPMPPERAAELMWQVSDALAAAHGEGIVHRDVKPSNILVTASGQAKLTDFGIARAQADASLTQTGLVTGSPAYLAPEVASGSTADTASDVWSLGATLFHCLAGRAPYDVGDNLVGGLYKIVHEEPPRLPGAGALGSLLEVTMAKDPHERWTMAQVRDHLAGLVHDPDLVATSAVAAAPAGGAVAGDHSEAAGDDEGTQVLAGTTEPTGPTEPTEPSGPAVAPPPDEGRHRRRGMLPLLAGAAAALVLVLVVIWATTDGDEEQPASSGGTPSETPSETPTESPTDTSSPSETQTTEGNDAAATEREMEAFIGDYLELVTTDQDAAFAMLTPEFQAASGGIEGYTGFWSTVADATLLDASADPESLQVSYRVRYRMAEGGTQTDDVTLQLVRQDDTYLIADEA